jgi:nitrous oxidase accessory protein NosD
MVLFIRTETRGVFMSKNVMQEIAAYIHQRIGKKYGFCVLIYEHNTDKGRMNYVSNSQREDVIKAMKEFIEETEGTWGTHKL